MARPNPYRPFTPDPEQLALVPPISGNDVNGLGETEKRRPNMVYWSPDPNNIPHGDLQRYFGGRASQIPAFLEKRATRQKINDAPLPPVAEDPVQRPPAEWTAALDAYVTGGDCERIGVADLRPDWVFQGHEIPQSRVIVIGVQHDYDAIKAAPETRAGLEVITQYTRAAAASKKIAGWLQEQGWEAEAVTGPMTGALAMIPPALACGFGELGKHGSIINPELGASFRLSAVLTDAPFAPTPSQDHGIDGFCQNCRICEDACPPEALFKEKQTVRGDTKWYVDFDKCLPFFNQTQGCAICIAVCPWSRPGIGPNLAAKLARKRERDAIG